MVSLLITPITLIIVSFLVKDKNISMVGRLIALLIMSSIGYHYTIGNEFFYIKEAIFDTLMFSTVFMLKDNIRSVLVGIPCILSFVLNIYEQFSYYQTIFYDYREYIQFIFMQLIILGLVVNCEWRKIWETHTQN